MDCERLWTITFKHVAVETHLHCEMFVIKPHYALITQPQAMRNVSRCVPCCASCLIEGDLAPMRLWRNQEEVLKLHALGRRTRCKLDSHHLSEHEGYCIPQLHACKMDTDA